MAKTFNAQRRPVSVLLTIGRRYRGTFNNLAAARDKYIALRETSGEGASTWPTGNVTMSDGRKLWISYNGRVWDGVPGNPGVQPIIPLEII